MLEAVGNVAFGVDQQIARQADDPFIRAATCRWRQLGSGGIGDVKLLRNERQRVKTITADNGTEFHNYRELENILGTQVYFATPHHAWERGTNENTNGLIRQYLPKGTNLSGLTQRQCDRIAEQLNNRPRLRLGFKTPNEVYY